MEQILEVNKIQSFPAKNDSFESSTEYEQINSVLGNLLANNGRVKSKEVPDARNRVSSLINSMMIIMKEIDPLFSSMKPESSERGSAKNRLKVFKPNEFDYDVILTLPIDEEEDKIVEPKDGCVKVIVSEEFPSWAECKVQPMTSFKWALPKKKHRKSWKRMFDKHGRLLSTGLRSWMQSLVRRTIDEAIEGKHGNDERITFKDWNEVSMYLSGPAVTLKLKQTEISIDLVATIKVPGYCRTAILKGLEYPEKVSIRLNNGEMMEPTAEKRSKTDGNKIVIGAEHVTPCFLVPVEPRVALDAPKPPGHLLRLSMPALDEQLLKDKKCLKDSIRLLKVLRDTNGWKPIASFFLQSLGIGAQIDPDDLNKLPIVFFKLLSLLVHHLNIGELPLPWAPGCNLFVKLNIEFRDNVIKRIENFFSKLKKVGLSVTGDGLEPLNSGQEKTVEAGEIKSLIHSFFVISESYDEQPTVATLPATGTETAKSAEN